MLARLCLLLGPLMFAASTFFWTDGRYGAAGGALVALSMPVWAFGIVALLGRLRARLPRYATALLLLTLFGVVGGAAFGLQGFFETVYGVGEQESLAALADYPVTARLLLWWLGPVFPATLFLLGVGLIRGRLLPLPLGVLLSAAAILFPVSRIPRIEWIAHAVDLMLLIPFAAAAVRMRSGRRGEPLDLLFGAGDDQQ